MSEHAPPDITFHAQDPAGEAGPFMSAFFACRHFLGALAFVTFREKARAVQGEAEERVDPDVIAAVLGHTGRDYVSPPSPELLPGVVRILVAHLEAGRFVTLRRGAGGWWNYDSLLEDIEPVSDIDAFLREPRGDRFWFGS